VAELVSSMSSIGIATSAVFSSTTIFGLLDDVTIIFEPAGNCFVKLRPAISMEETDSGDSASFSTRSSYSFESKMLLDFHPELVVLTEISSFLPGSDSAASGSEGNLISIFEDSIAVGKLFVNVILSFLPTISADPENSPVDVATEAMAANIHLEKFIFCINNKRGFLC